MRLRLKVEKAFNAVLDRARSEQLCPWFFKEVEKELKKECDNRYKLFALAASNTSAIVEYIHSKFYVYLDKGRYVVEYK